MLSEKDKQRYARQIKLPEMGVSGQEKLLNARVLVVGAGGLGCPVLQYLAAAGVGFLGIVDDDIVDLSNLQRQVLYTEYDIGEFKAKCAAQKLSEINSTLDIRAYSERLIPENAERLISQVDLVVDCSDNFNTRYLINDACRILSKPWVYAGIHKYEGQISVFNYSSRVKPEFSYRTLFPTPSDDQSKNTCEETGVLGVLPGIIGVLQATEVLKIITGIGEVLKGKLLVFNSLTMQSQIIDLADSLTESTSGPATMDELVSTKYSNECNPESEMKEITVEELQQWIDSGKPIRFLDVRQPGEWPEAEGIIDLQIPLPLVEKESTQISRDVDVVVYCNSGQRSERAIELLTEKHQFNNLIKLVGGVEEWVSFREKLL